MFFPGRLVGEEVILRSLVCWECSVRGDGLDGESEGEEVEQAACLQRAIQRAFVGWYIWAKSNKPDFVP